VRKHSPFGASPIRLESHLQFVSSQDPFRLPFPPCCSTCKSGWTILIDDRDEPVLTMKDVSMVARRRAA
jgi:hypothetical protein